MIGVIANPSQHVVVEEFFQLFKTPWEFCKPGRQYEVLLCAGDGDFDQDAANVVLVYAGRKVFFDTTAKIEVSPQVTRSCVLSYKGHRLPIYGDSVTFAGNTHVLVLEEHGKPVSEQKCGNHLVRIGYDLFEEVRTLLSAGQPASNAGIPTLELHIALLRELILASGMSLCEIPPVPAGYRLIACLTHDIDHPSIRLHRFDPTTLGFLYRASVGSIIRLLRGRISWTDLLTNLLAVARLPLIHLGLAEDFWNGFDDYLELESGLCSSFFVIPFKDRPGQGRGAGANNRRAARYGASDLADQILQSVTRGCEIGVHGIDAWCDSVKGREELEEVRQVTGLQNIGIRMHWLYFNGESPALLEAAGAEFDSSIGYNQTVGYRAGTTQVYKPLSATRLLELPLHIMDTALFYPGYLDLTPPEAQEQIRRIVANAAQFGGVITVNWHDRSLAPERLWGTAYVELLDELKRQGAWFATATQAVSWFKKRRSAVLEDISGASGDARIRVTADATKDLPDLLLRLHKSREIHEDVVVETVASGQCEPIADQDVKAVASDYVAVS